MPSFIDFTFNLIELTFPTTFANNFHFNFFSLSLKYFCNVYRFHVLCSPIMTINSNLNLSNKRSEFKNIPIIVQQ